MKDSSARLLCVLAAGVLCACAGYSPSSFGPGAARGDVVKVMGQPTGEYALPNGQTRLEFARGPFGKHTYMVDFDANDHLAQWRQVLTEANINSVVHMGMDQRELLREIGRPAEKMWLPRQQQSLWSYRYETNECLWFQVGIGQDGKVADMGYGIDHRCDTSDGKDRSL